jgi:hypothetical protein
MLPTAWKQEEWNRHKQKRLEHTAGSDTIFVQIYMDALPGVPGVSKNSQKYATKKTVEFLRKYCPKVTNFEKSSKLKKKMSKKPVFLDKDSYRYGRNTPTLIFEIWNQ